MLPRAPPPDHDMTLKVGRRRSKGRNRRGKALITRSNVNVLKFGSHYKSYLNSRISRRKNHPARQSAVVAASQRDLSIDVFRISGGTPCRRSLHDLIVFFVYVRGSFAPSAFTIACDEHVEIIKLRPTGDWS